MLRDRIALTRVLVAALLLTSLSVAAIGSVAGQGDSSGPYTLSELRQGGEQINADVESLRMVGENALFIDTAPTNPMRPDNPGALTTGNVLESGERVTTNELRAKWLSSETGVSLTFKVVYWQVDSREVERNGTTVTERYAANQTVTTHNVTFSEPFGTASIPLREHYDQEVRMTVWVDGYSESARWTATHKSLETSQTVTTETKGDRLWWLISNFVVWLLIFGFITVAIVYAALRRAGGGPQMGYFAWALLIGIGGFIAISWNYQGLATLFVRGPKLLAGLTVALLSIPIIEGHDDRLDRYLFVKPVVTRAVNASGEEAKDALYLELAERKVTNLRGERSVIRGGPIKFLARVISGKAPLIGAPEMSKTEVHAEGSTKHDHVVWINPNSDEIIDDQAEGFEFESPPRDIWVLGGVGLLMMIFAPVLGMGWLKFVGAIGPIVFACSAITVRRGYAEIDPAPAHQRPAHVTMMLGSSEMDDAETLEQAREETYRERARSSKDVEEVVELRDESLVEEMMGVDISASVTEEDRPDRPAATDGGEPEDE